MKHLVLMSCPVLTCVSAFSQSPTDFSAIDLKLKACETAHVDADGSAHCQIDAFTAADKRLNAVYANITTALRNAGPKHTPDDDEVVKRLVAAERAWVVFRDAQCNYMSTMALHAPLEGYEYHSCRYELTKERIKALTAVDAPQSPR